MIEWHRRILRYDGWANREVAAALHSEADPPARAVALLAHIIGAQWLWLARLQEVPSGMAVWPDLSAAECGAELSRLDQAWNGYLDALGPDDLRRGVSYRNSKGESWTSTVADVLAHVAVHGVYHRGQVATVMREHGGAPAYTDFIHATRQGFLA